MKQISACHDTLVLGLQDGYIQILRNYTLEFVLCSFRVNSAHLRKELKQMNYPLSVSVTKDLLAYVYTEINEKATMDSVAKSLSTYS